MTTSLEIRCLEVEITRLERDNQHLQRICATLLQYPGKRVDVTPSPFDLEKWLLAHTTDH